MRLSLLVAGYRERKYLTQEQVETLDLHPFSEGSGVGSGQGVLNGSQPPCPFPAVCLRPKPTTPGWITFGRHLVPVNASHSSILGPLRRKQPPLFKN